MFTLESMFVSKHSKKKNPEYILCTLHMILLTVALIFSHAIEYNFLGHLTAQKPTFTDRK